MAALVVGGLFIGMVVVGAVVIGAAALWGVGGRRMAREHEKMSLAELDEVIRLDPGDADAHVHRGNTWYDLKKHDQALADYDQAIRLDLTNLSYLEGRVDTHLAMHRFDAALDDYGEIIRLDPESFSAHNMRAWLWATCIKDEIRDGEQAVAAATRACELSEWQDADALDTLAAAYAQRGEFDLAVQTMERALDLAYGVDFQKDLLDRMKLYSSKQAYRQSPDIYEPRRPVSSRAHPPTGEQASATEPTGTGEPSPTAESTATEALAPTTGQEPVTGEAPTERSPRP